MWKLIFTLRIIKHWESFARSSCAPPPLEVLKTQPDGALSNLICAQWGPCWEQGVGPGISWGPLLPQGFCDSAWQCAVFCHQTYGPVRKRIKPEPTCQLDHTCSPLFFLGYPRQSTGNGLCLLQGWLFLYMVLTRAIALWISTPWIIEQLHEYLFQWYLVQYRVSRNWRGQCSNCMSLKKLILFTGIKSGSWTAPRLMKWCSYPWF